jgi:hypothetical protein
VLTARRIDRKIAVATRDGHESVAVVDLSDAAAVWRRDGFVVLPSYLDGPELDAARRDLAAVYPSAEEYHAAPDQGRNRAYTGDEFGGIITFPFPTVALCQVAVHEKIVALAEAVFETIDIRISTTRPWCPRRATCAGGVWKCSSGLAMCPKTTGRPTLCRCT